MEREYGYYYVAADGKKFFDEEECEQYEKENLCRTFTVYVIATTNYTVEAIDEDDAADKAYDLCRQEVGNDFNIDIDDVEEIEKED